LCRSDGLCRSIDEGNRFALAPGTFRPLGYLTFIRVAGY
jgi:hypothetical protein